MATLQQSILIGATVKQSYAYIADIERVRDWLPRIIEAQRTSAIKAGAGAELAIVAEAGGKRTQGTSRCTAADAPHRLAFTSTLDVGLTSTTTFDLVVAGKQTQVTATVDYAFTGRSFGRLLGGLFGDKYARQDIITALGNLKMQIEAVQAQRLQRKRATPAL
jgi:ribosome-associated toxin RatA of RatAB toxin-antitoxin module